MPRADQDDVGQRRQFIASTTSFRQDLDRLSADGLDPREQRLLRDARREFTAFMAVDARIVAGYRSGEAGRIQDSNALASGDSLVHFGKLADDVSSIADSVSARADVLTRNAQADIRSGRNVMVVTGLGALLLALGLAALATASVTRPLRRLSSRLDEIAGGGGDLTARLPEEGRDELADVSRSFNRFVASLQELVGTISDKAGALGAASSTLVGMTDTLSAAAGTTSQQASVVSDAASTVDRSLQVAAVAAEEIRASINEIARSASAAADVVSTAVAVAGRTGATLQQLRESSLEIDDVLELIAGIAKQTHLLSLNATIEAARAGSAGVGFAVVAGEVKGLAQESRRGADLIREKLVALQEAAFGAAQDLDEIAAVVARVNDHAVTIATAVEEQTATTAEVSRSLSGAAAGSRDIVAGIAGVAGMAVTTSTEVSTGHHSAAAVADLATDLAHLVEAFTV